MNTLGMGIEDMPRMEEWKSGRVEEGAAIIQYLLVPYSPSEKQCEAAEG